MSVSENSVTPKSSIFIGFPIINHPFWGTLIFGKKPYEHACICCHGEFFQSVTVAAQKSTGIGKDCRMNANKHSTMRSPVAAQLVHFY